MKIDYEIGIRKVYDVLKCQLLDYKDFTSLSNSMLTGYQLKYVIFFKTGKISVRIDAQNSLILTSLGP